MFAFNILGLLVGCANADRNIVRYVFTTEGDDCSSAV